MNKSFVSTDGQKTENPRSKIFDSYITAINNSIIGNRPQIKLINYGTGSGKTHQLFQAIYETIKQYPDIQVMGVYVAPLREHLQVPEEVKNLYPDIPVYKIHSLEMKTTDELLTCYKKWVPTILKNKDIWRKDDKKYSVQENRARLAKVAGVINQIEYIMRANFGNKDTNEKLLQDAVRELDKSIEGFLEFLIKSNDSIDVLTSECMKLMEIFFPLHLLREKSGIILLTYDKYRTSLPYFQFKDGRWIRQNSTLDVYVQKKSQIKFIFAFDEQEDGYERMLDTMIDIISPEALAINNALSSVSREFSALFSKGRDETRHLLKFINENPAILDEFDEYAERSKPVEEKLKALYETYRQLIYEQGNSRNFLQQLVKLNKSLDEALHEVSAVFDEHNDGEPIKLNFDMLPRVFEKFENNRSLLIHHDLYNRIKDDLANIFSYNNLYIYNIEPLRELHLYKSAGGHAFIADPSNADGTSLAELIYVILAVRLQIKLIQGFLINVLDAEDSQSRSIDIWAKQISRVQQALQDDSSEYYKFNKYLDRYYVYESYKSIINIMEIDRYQNPSNNLINYDLREVSIGSTAVLGSPEQKINSLAVASNVIFLISATGGITGDLSTSYDMRYLEDRLRDENGISGFVPMSPAEIELCEEIREHRQTNRQITVGFFNHDPASFPNDATTGVSSRFTETVLEKFLDSIKNETGWFSTYKKQELVNFIYFLFYLLEDEQVNQTIAFTQTLRWIKSLIKYCELSKYNGFVFTQSEVHPDIYYVQIGNNSYRSSVRIKLILYDAAFNTRYFKKNGSTYLDELVEKQGEKIFFISAYQSASKGLNPVVRTSSNSTKDFDSLVLLMDSFYSVMKPPVKRSEKSTHGDTRYHFALMKSIVKIGNLNMEIKDFNKYLNQPEAEEFRRLQHKILLGKGALQAIGRIERRDFPNQITKIFINEETRRNLLNFYKYLDSDEPNELRKLSANNREVYVKVLDEEKKKAIPNYANHIDREIDAVSIFQEFRERMLDDIEAFHNDSNLDEIIKTWDAMRDSLAFRSPKLYLETLRESGLFPSDFVDSLFFSNPKPGELTPYLVTEEYSGQRYKIISDSINGEGPFTYAARLYPEYFKVSTRLGLDSDDGRVASFDSSTDAIYRLYNEILPAPEIFDVFIPRPHFFYDVLYPSLTEHFVERWIKQVLFHGKSASTIKNDYGYERLSNFKKYNQLYERFDIYYVKDRTLFCIDVKAWSKEAGNRLSKRTIEKAEKKIDLIAAVYPEFTNVRGLLLNLHSEKEKSHQYSSALYSGNLIYFDNYYAPVASNVLRDFLFPKDR